MATSSKSSFHIDWRRALLPLSLLALVLLYFFFGVPIWALAVLTLWIPLYYLVYPSYVRKRWSQFDKEFAQKFQKGQYKQLLEVYRDQWFLRKFGPKAEMLGKLALIYSAMDKYREAEQALERALDHAGPGQKQRLFFNLANVKFELSKYEDAEQIYRALKKGTPYAHSARTHLALIDLKRGRHVDKARKLLADARDNASGATRERIDRVLETVDR